MEILENGIVVFKDYFLRNEEVIKLANDSPNWRPGTVGKDIDPKRRITDIHDLDNQTELHKELLDTFISGINKYVDKYKHCKVKGGESLRVGRYQKDGYYSVHTDAHGSERTLSAILYLNDDYEGGDLHFPYLDLTIKPEAGMLILFPSNFIYAHGSTPVTDGKKYIVVSWFQ